MRSPNHHIRSKKKLQKRKKQIATTSPAPFAGCTVDQFLSQPSLPREVWIPPKPILVERGRERERERERDLSSKNGTVIDMEESCWHPQSTTKVGLTHVISDYKVFLSIWRWIIDSACWKWSNQLLRGLCYRMLYLIWVNGWLLSNFRIDVLFSQERTSYSSPFGEE